jgi:HEAT repeat protein
MAWLCLGGMAKGLAGTAADRSQAIIAQLTEALAESTDENAKGLLLQALGNANSALAMPAVAPYATSASPVLRAAAMDAMRTIALPQADPILRRALATDADPRVRLEAAFALGFRNPDADLFAAEKAALAGEQDTQVRTALLNDLAKLVGVFPEARTVIKAAADNDPSDDVRKAAADLLQSLAAPSAPP